VTAPARYAALSAEEYQASTALELARRVAAGELSPVQLTDCALHLAEEAEPAINAYAALLAARARREAAEREAEVHAGRVRGPLHGVPIAVKDNFYYQGEPTGKGSLTSSDEPAAESAPMVARLVDAGAVVIGKTTTPEFGWKGTGSSPRTGVTRNPWQPDRTSGGSSAGSGATVGSGAVPVATGTDAGGSIRIPAAFCGVVGFKPTLGAIPVWPGTVNETLSHAGPLTRSVADARAVFELTRGPDPRDPQSAFPAPRTDRPGRRLRVGVLREPFGIAPDPTVATVFGRACGLIAAMTGADLTGADLTGAAMTGAELIGAELTELPGLGAALPRDVFEAMWVTGRGLGFADLIRRRGDVMDPGLTRLLPLAQEYSLARYYQALETRRAFNAQLFALFGDWDLLVTPTMPITAFPAGAEVPPGGEAEAPLPWITWTPYTYPFNISGQPAITVPCGLAADGLPAGLQVVGPWGHDRRVLDFAEACEQALAPLNPARVAPVPKGDPCAPLSASRESTRPRCSSSTSGRSTGWATTPSG
jgi:aspartyl-tRNA(Asn)/glutamyl-tRNA(Gln) amidotransferase subunit A